MKACGITIRSLADGRPLFDLIIYGVPVSQLTSVPAGKWPEDDAKHLGGALVRQALRKRGMDPDALLVSVFDVFELRGYRDGNTVEG